LLRTFSLNYRAYHALIQKGEVTISASGHEVKEDGKRAIYFIKLRPDLLYRIVYCRYEWDPVYHDFKQKDHRYKYCRVVSTDHLDSKYNR
jgi:hypothetical protein